MTDDVHPTLRQLGDDMARIFSPPQSEDAQFVTYLAAEMEHLLTVLRKSPEEVKRDYGSTDPHAFLVGYAQLSLANLAPQARRG